MAQVRLIQAAREAAPDAVVVHASTRPVLRPRARSCRSTKTSRWRRPTPTACRRFAGEQYWMLEHRVRGRPVVSLRLTNCYGAAAALSAMRARPFLGIWIRCVLEGRPFEVWGGAQLRDMTYVDDVTDVPRRRRTRRRATGVYSTIGGPPPASLQRSPRCWFGSPDRPLQYTSAEFLPIVRAHRPSASYHADDSAFRAATRDGRRARVAGGGDQTIAGVVRVRVWRSICNSAAARAPRPLAARGERGIPSARAGEDSSASSAAH